MTRYNGGERMAEVVRSRWARRALLALGVMALGFGTARLSAAQTIDERLRASRPSFGGTEGFVDPSGRAFTFCRVAYRQVRREPMGQGWRTDYPDADRNLMLRLSQLTTTPIRTTPQGRPDHLIVQLDNDEIFECPFIFMSDVGTMALNPEEAERLRKYLLRGGFLWVDDFWGDFAWDKWVDEISKALPPGEYPIEDVPSGHMIFNALYNVYEVPQIPSIQYWRRSGGGTSERGFESAVPHLRSIRDSNGRIIVLMSHNTDIADGWEREGEEEAFFFRFSPKAYALGINIVLYALTH
jgi:hypothetical protein